MVCGEKLIYRANAENLACYFCGDVKPGSISCVNNHFVCDACHGKDALSAITGIALNTTSDDPIAIAEQMMSHPSVPMIGGEHHAIVATAVTAALMNSVKNSGPIAYNDQPIHVNNDLIERTLDRSWTERLPSCMCANYGTCGAGLAAGAVFSLLTGATCDTPKLTERQLSMQIANSALSGIASYRGTCCKLSTRISIEAISEAIEEYFGVKLPRQAITCQHKKRNPYKCLGSACPFSNVQTR